MKIYNLSDYTYLFEETNIFFFLAVNTAKRNAENLRRLEELQKRLVTAPYDRENFGNDYNSLNLTQ